MMNKEYALIERTPEVVEYNRVRQAAGLSVKDEIAAEHQQKGVGRMIMDALVSYIDAHARPTSIVCLMANKGIAPFYEKYGFRARDTDMPGMIIRK